jgi:5-methylcytosine-specific restriction endonuclease McrA
MTEDIATKVCNRCKQQKPISDFYRCSKWRDGLDYSCKACRTEMNLASRAKAMRDPVKADEIRKRGNEWKKEKRINDPVFREKDRVRARKYLQEHRDVCYAAGSRRKARKLGGGGSHSSESWRQLRELFGNVCVCCGKEKKLTRDHVIPLSRGGSDSITNIQPLCMDCNKSKFTGNKDYRTREKVVLPELNEVGHLLFDGGLPEIPEHLKKHKTKSGYTGVYYAQKTTNSKKIWRAIITVGKIRIHLGRYATEREAAEVYNKVSRQLLGESAYVNELN